MKKMIAKVKKIWHRDLNIRLLCFITFMISFSIIGIIYGLNEVTPFGNKSLLQIDFYHQYGPMLGELYDRIHNLSSLVYSFSMGLGLPLFRNFLNYMASPFNIIMLFFKRSDLLTSYSIIIGLKAIISSVTMVYYLSKKYKTTELYLISFGLIYAFSAYFSAYYWNLMWLDGMVYLPLITLGIEKIVDDGNWRFYAIWLAIMILSNYYIGYMVCIFACLYFVIYSLNRKNFKKGKIKTSLNLFFKDSIKFGIGSLIAGGIMAVFLIPLFYSIFSISATGGDIPSSQYYSFLVGDFLKYHFSGVLPTVLASGKLNVPNISCGILSLSLLLVFIVNVEVPIKEKLGYIILIGFFIVAFFYAPLDYILQGFHVPNDLPYRYSFIYSFVLILISVYSFKNIKKINYRLMIVIFILLSISLLVLSNGNFVGMSENMIYINMVILGIYFILYSVSYTKKINLKIIYVIMVFASIFDVILSVNENFDVSQMVDIFYNDYDLMEDKINYIHQLDDELFYRIERENGKTLNDSSWYNYYGVTSFSSMNYENMAILQHNLGIKGNFINSYEYKQNTPIYDVMFGIKYLIGNINDNDRYTSLSYMDGDISKNDYYVGVGYGVNRNIATWEKKYDNPFIMQNEYMRLATGVDDILVPLDIVNKKIIFNNGRTIVKYVYNNPGDNVYFYTDNYNVDFFVLDNCLYYSNDNYANYDDVIQEFYYKLDSYNEKRIVNFKTNADVVEIYVGYNNYYQDSFELYTINDMNFKTAIKKLQDNKLNITSFKESKIEGNITLDDNMVVYTSIPFDDGWHILVDGKEVRTKSLGGALLAFDCAKGEHDIVIYYKAKGLFWGIIVSFMSLIQLIVDKLLMDEKR